ncbi:gamma-tubulin complex component 2-like [Tropilaelaps mercedesae]|uniref:Gamma-tubulin complex component n=1 Tax=Tropilaelaps mercedesae TaxID=418985 RepID=A0A1V9XNS1_9ACAR|nr:gamma-tubulin complex component 2-like [Tropilaelaps mercedesae]
MELLRGFKGAFERPSHVGKESDQSTRGNFAMGMDQPLSHCAALGSLNMETQERWLIRGVLCILGLTPHDLVWSERMKSGECKIHFHSKLNEQLVSEAKDFSDLVRQHCAIRQFINDYQSTEFSLTLQSLVGCLNSVLNKFSLSLVTVSDQAHKLTLKLLQQQFAQHRVVLLTLSDLCATITKDRLDGAAILTYLHNFFGNSGNSVVRDLYERCLREAMRPYVSMLRQWLKGQFVIDPQGEFMIQVRPPYLREADSISTKYEVLVEKVPSFLLDLTDDILTAGCYAEMVNTVEIEFEEKITTEATVDKYLLESVGPASCLSVEELQSGVQAVLAETSATLFRLMNKFGDLDEHLVSFKEVYLFVRADIFKRFCDLSRGQLIVSNSMCSPMVLNNFLADAVSGSAASVFTQSHMGLKFLEETLSSRLVTRAVREGFLKEEEGARLLNARQASLGGSGHTFECIATDLRGGWILQHLITPDAREMYELIFGVRLQLFLGECFCADVMPYCTGLARSLLQRMLVFAQSISAYFSIFSVEQEWSRLQKRLTQVRTVDSLARTHSDYVQRIYRRCLLDNLEASMRLISIASTVLQAAMCIDRLVNPDNMLIQPAGSSKPGTSATNSECFVDVEQELGALEIMAMPEGGLSDVVEYFERQFDTAVARWLDTNEIKTHEQLLTLLAMNECYTVRRPSAGFGVAY